MVEYDIDPIVARARQEGYGIGLRRGLLVGGIGIILVLLLSLPLQKYQCFVLPEEQVTLGLIRETPTPLVIIVGHRPEWPAEYCHRAVGGDRQYWIDGDKAKTDALFNDLDAVMRRHFDRNRKE